MILTKSFDSAVFVRALAPWWWLDTAGKTPVLSSLFGDVFFEATEGYWYLDVVEGTISREWPSRAALVAELDSEDGQDRWLMGALAIGAHERGTVLAAEEVYVFAPPPILTGIFDVETIMAMDFPTAMAVAAQIHERLR